MLKPLFKYGIHTFDFQGQKFQMLITKTQYAKDKFLVEITVAVAHSLVDGVDNVALYPCMNEKHATEVWKMYNCNKFKRDEVAVQILEKITAHLSVNLN